MKIIITGLFCILMTGSAYSQANVIPGKDQDHYLQKTKNLKTTGWVFFAGGLTIAAVGGLIQLHDNKVWKNNTETWDIVPDFRGLYTILAGGSIALLSTPFFILSGTNKRKAAFLSLNHQQIQFDHNFGTGQNSVITVMATIRF